MTVSFSMGTKPHGVRWVVGWWLDDWIDKWMDGWMNEWMDRHTFFTYLQMYRLLTHSKHKATVYICA